MTSPTFLRQANCRRAGLLALGLLAAAPAAHAQQVLLQTDVATDTLPPRTGPNRRYFGHLYGGFGLAAGASPLGVRYGFPSSEAQIGGRLKRRLGPYFAFNADLRYAYLRYGLSPEVARPLPFRPDPGPGFGFDTQIITYHQLQAEGSLRLSPSRRRGNTVGRYLDLLAYGGRSLAANYTASGPSGSGGRREIVEHQPSYLARWQGGVGLRLGSNSVALVGRYRLSELLPGTGLPEPPRWVLGIEVGWF
ncbi:MAG: hypothetical protein ACRYG7_22170 [Janthinobacterium lividum]